MAPRYGPKIVKDGLVLALDAASAKSSLSAVEVLVVAGGGAGAGGIYNGGGGGAGGLIYRSLYSVTPGQSCVVTVGAGGAGTNNKGSNGSNSLFDSLTAIGGGAGGAHPGNPQFGNSGGSGGGGSQAGGAGGSGTLEQGNSGGGLIYAAGAGGGGAGAAVVTTGMTAAPYIYGTAPVTGGIGLQFSISGTPTYYAGGGGGGGRNAYSVPQGAGGLGGGGAGAPGTGGAGSAGAVNTGGGGGGSYSDESASNTQVGGSGGSGIVIVRYKGSQRASGGTISFVNGYTVHTFTTSGTFTPNGAPGTETIWTDTSKKGNSGTLINGAQYNNTNGASFIFDGVNDYVNCPNSSSLNVIESITMESWIYPTAYKTSGGAGGMIATKLTYYMELAGSGVIRVYFYGLSSEGYHNGTINIPLNSWSHVVGMRDKVNNSIKIYVNGILDREITSITGNIASNSLQVTIGSYNGPGYEYTGKIANTKIYNRALTALEVKQNFNALRGRYGL